MRWTRSLRFGPALLAALAGVVLSASLGYKLWRERVTTLDTASAQTQRFAGALEEHARQTLHRVGSHLKQANEVLNDLHHEGVSDETLIRRELAEVLPADRLIHSFVLLDTRGRVVFTTVGGPPEPIPDDRSDRDYFRPHVRGADRELVFGAPEKMGHDGSWEMPVSRRFSLPDGSWGGVLVAWVQPEYFQPFYDSIIRGEKGTVTLFLTSGRAAVSSPVDETRMRRDWSSAPLFREHMPRWPTGTELARSVVDGAQRLYSYRVLNDYPVVVSYALDTEALLAGWRATAGRDGLLLLLALTVLASAALALTRRDQARREAERSRAQMRVAQSANEAKTEFLARMSHELRTPLNAVLGFAQLLDDRSEPLTTRQQRNVRLLRDGGQHLLALIDDMLDVASIEAGRHDIACVAVPLDEVVEASIASCAAAAEGAQVHVEARLPAEAALHVSADPTRLRQVLANLLSNGIKYNRAGGRVTVQATATAERVRIAVIDDGLGLTPEQQRNLFTPYDRLGRERSGILGTGIGLVLARQLVELMGGTLTLCSEAERGSTVTVELARSDAVPAPAGRVSTQPGRLQGGGLVLYIEDEPVNQVLVQETLRGCADIELLMADNGQQGLALARARRPDLLLLDMQLPDMNGPQVMQALRSDVATRDITVVALSAGAMSEDIERARAAGAIEYWTKPFDVAQLRADVRRILAAA